nr:FtsX-like permease family protein [Geomicrobium sp. JCM 19055]
MGLYQLIGLSKMWISRVLIFEYFILGVGALGIGIIVGTLLSRLFLLLFINLIGLDAMVGLTFSFQAIIQTIIVFICLIFVTSLQILLTVYRSTLLKLFQANNSHDFFIERPNSVSIFFRDSGFEFNRIWLLLVNIYYRKSRFTVIFHVSSIGKYYTRNLFSLPYNAELVIICFSKEKNGNLGLYNSLSVAPLMHRIKGQANSLTLITVLSAMTITMTSLSFSLYYSTEDDVRLAMPFDFALENMHDEAALISSRLEEENIEFMQHHLDSIRFDGEWIEQNSNIRNSTFMLFSAEQMTEAGLDVAIPQDGKAIYHNTRAIIEGKEVTFPMDVRYPSSDEINRVTVSELELENVMNYRFYGEQLLVSNETFERIKGSIRENENKELLSFDVFQILDIDKADTASTIFLSSVSSDEFITDFYSAYEGSIQNFGLLIFIAGFLGFVFLLSTGSILYFKQMIEADQERNQYRTLRQLGFQVDDIMKGIIRKQLFVFLIPLGIGLIHAAFALNVGSDLIAASMLTPIMISMGAYVAIYLMFTVVTIRYYKTIVMEAL